MANLAEVIKCECGNDVVIWKHPIEDFNTMTQLIVHESQEAVFYLNGMVQDVLGPGRHTLTTENIPVLTKALNILTNNKNPFHCEVYFVNKVELMNEKWGIPESFVYQALINGEKLPFNLTARGDMSFKVDNGRKLLEKIVGTEESLTREQLSQKMFSLVVSGVKSNLVRVMSEQQIDLFEVDSRLDELSSHVRPIIEDSLIDYGIQLELFMILQVKLPEDDPNFQMYKKLRFKSLTLGNVDLEEEILIRKKQAEMQRMEIEARGMAQKRQIEGYTYHQERSFDIAESAATNEGTAQFSNLGIGLGMMTGVGSTIGNQIGEMTRTMMDNPNQPQQTAQGAQKYCMNCGTVLPANAKFCFGCGHKLESKCANCGTELPEGAKFCLNCGTQV